MIERCNSLADGLSVEQMAATFEPALAFPRLATSDFKMLRQFFSKTATKTFFDIGTNRIQTPYLLFG